MCPLLNRPTSETLKRLSGIGTIDAKSENNEDNNRQHNVQEAEWTTKRHVYAHTYITEWWARCNITVAWHEMIVIILDKF